jgi:anti-sigma B factor antagonist
VAGGVTRADEELIKAPVASIEQRGDAVVVALQGDVDLYNTEQLRTALREARERAERRVVVDLGSVTFIDSTGLGVLVEAHRARADDKVLLLAAPQLETRRALEISGLDRHLRVHETVAQALAAAV